MRSDCMELDCMEYVKVSSDLVVKLMATLSGSTAKPNVEGIVVVFGTFCLSWFFTRLFVRRYLLDGVRQAIAT